MNDARFQQLDALVWAALAKAGGAPGTASADLVIEQTLSNIAASGVETPVISFPVNTQNGVIATATWMITDQVTGNIALRQQGRGFHNINFVGAGFNPITFATDIGLPPSTNLAVFGNDLRVTVTNPLGANLIRARCILALRLWS